MLRVQHFGTPAIAALVAVLFLMAVITESVDGVECGGNLTGSGRFTSPNYPLLYPADTNCQWTLTADASTGNGNAVSLFIEELYLEENHDILDVYAEGILMARYSENTAPHKAVYGRKVTVVFRSDSANGAKGFSILFNSTGPECGTSCTSQACSFWTPNFPYPLPKESHCEWIFINNNGATAFESTTVSAPPFTGELRLASTYRGSPITATYIGPAPIPTADIFQQFVALNFTSRVGCRVGTGILVSLAGKVGSCGSQLLGSGTFSTPLYPNLYPTKMICLWKLKAFQGLRVQLNVAKVSLRAPFDYVRVYSDNQLIGSYTLVDGPFNLTLGSDVTIEFQSGEPFSAGYRGFSASFISV